MSRKSFFTKLILILLSAACYLLFTAFDLSPVASWIVLAQEPDYDRINDIAKDLNCPTCTGINLSDCRTLTCEQWRDKIGDLVEEGYSDQEVLDYFSTRYGPQVLQEPPRSGFTLALWLIPVIALLAGGVWLVYTIRGWSKREVRPVTVEASAANVVSSASPSPDDYVDDYLSQVEKDLGLKEEK